MTASAAAAAGYTLAAGPVRADVIKTDTTPGSQEAQR
jgi:carboxymethylenebutenolidase